jgi:hypothetical protein
MLEPPGGTTAPRHGGAYEVIFIVSGRRRRHVTLHSLLFTLYSLLYCL